ncbi:unnamed protein product [Moneuplotes crassus]|uniref:Uncharacterized protein n=1 Tax=Euplotes crassus TaxID=5936 RepID=A0AAD1X231_EUPCR|nr:unnamed protein product [Moneuplotes crassus]
MMTKFLKNAIKEQKIKNSASPKRDIQIRKEKLDQYTKLVKDLHPPKVSKLKAKEMKALKDAIINTRARNKSSISFSKDDKNKLNSLTNYNSEYANRSANGFTVPSHRVQKSHITWNFENNFLPKPKEKKEPKVTDFLKEQREKKSIENFNIKLEPKLRGSERNFQRGKRNSPTNNSMDIRKHSNLIEEGSPQSSKEFYSKFKNSHVEDPEIRNQQIAVARAHAKRSEEEVNRIEMQMKYSRGTNVKDVVSMNEILLGAIESKLNILDRMNDL